MTQPEITREILEKILDGIRDVHAQDRKIQRVTVVINFKKKPNLLKAGYVELNIIKKKS